MRIMYWSSDVCSSDLLNSSAFNAARMVGPALGGILLSMYGEAVCFGINFISFFAVIASLLLMRLKPQQAITRKESTWQGLKEGFSYLRHSPHISSLIMQIGRASFRERVCQYV